MNRFFTIIAVAAVTLQFPGAAKADQNSGPTHPGAYVLCKDGSMYGYHFDGNGGSTYASAVALCNLNGGGVSRQNIVPRNPLFWGDGKTVIAADPRSGAILNPVLVPVIRDVLSNPEKAIELRNLLRRNDADGVRRLLIAASPGSREQIEAIRRAKIGPVDFPVFQIINNPPHCTPPSSPGSAVTYTIGGVLVTEVNTDSCSPTG